MSINGVSVDTSNVQDVDGVVAAINAQANLTGVTASRKAVNTNTATYTADATNTNNLKINGVAVSIAANATIIQAADAINSATSSTGVRATVNGNQLLFNSFDGATFELQDDAANGVLTNYNGATTARGNSATFSAGITLTAKTQVPIAVSEMSFFSSTAKDLQLLGAITVATNSVLNNVSLSGGAVQSQSNVHIINASATTGAVLSLNDVIVDNLIVDTGAVVNISNSIIKNYQISGGAVVNAGNSQFGGGTVSGGAVFNNGSPAGSPSPPITKSLSVASLDISTTTGAQDAIVAIDTAIQQIGMERGKQGALQSSLEMSISSLQVGAENLSAARSRIRDTDYGVAVAGLTSGQIAQQAGIAMLAQASSQPQQVLTLLRGWM